MMLVVLYCLHFLVSLSIPKMLIFIHTANVDVILWNDTLLDIDLYLMRSSMFIYPYKRFNLFSKL